MKKTLNLTVLKKIKKLNTVLTLHDNVSSSVSKSKMVNNNNNLFYSTVYKFKVRKQ